MMLYTSYLSRKLWPSMWMCGFSLDPIFPITLTYSKVQLGIKSQSRLAE